MKVSIVALPLLASVALAVDASSLLADATSALAGAGIDASSLEAQATAALSSAGGISGIEAKATAALASIESKFPEIASIESAVKSGGVSALEGLETNSAVLSYLQANPSIAAEASSILGADGLASATGTSGADAQSTAGSDSGSAAITTNGAAGARVGGVLVLVGAAVGAAMIL